MDYPYFGYMKGLRDRKSTLLPPEIKQNLSSLFDNNLSLSILLLAKKEAGVGQQYDAGFQIRVVASLACVWKKNPNPFLRVVLVSPSIREGNMAVKYQ